jgi:LPS sulfotransferase NodH
VSSPEDTFDALYAQRQGTYVKAAGDEDFLEGLNAYLAPRERQLYGDYEIEHPLIFVVGAPRSGTTLLSQLLAYCLDVGFVDNFAARFWLAPVHGIRLSKLIAGGPEAGAFESEYARTSRPTDIHEFGYFWRHWLNKHTFDDVVHAAEHEDEIDWDGLRLTLANIQHELGRPLVAKNMLGAYHMPRLRRELGKVVFVCIERDPLDACVSILDARRKYYSDPASWWSYVPVEYPLLKDLDPWEQVAGQVHYLGAYYDHELAAVGADSSIRVSYQELCTDPAGVLRRVASTARDTYGCEVGVREQPPAEFPFRTYADRDADKARFADLLARFQARS